MQRLNHFLQRSACPACQSQHFETIFVCSFLDAPIRGYLECYYSGRAELDYLSEAAYELMECRDCNMMFQRFVPGDFLMQKLYEEWVGPPDDLTKHFSKGTPATYLRCVHEILSVGAFLQIPLHQLTVIDFGMGWGRWCSVAHAFECDTYGIELSRPRVDYARSRGLKVICWDEIADRRYHFINTDQVFEHLAEPLETLRYLSSNLHRDGLIKINVPNAAGFKRKLAIGDWMAPRDSKNSLMPVAPLEHINCFSRKALLKMAEAAGLVEVKIPLSIQWQYASDWTSLRQAIRNFSRPVRTNILNQGACLFFRQCSTGSHEHLEE